MPFCCSLWHKEQQRASRKALDCQSFGWWLWTWPSTPCSKLEVVCLAKLAVVVEAQRLWLVILALAVM